MNCPSCSALISDTAKFCPECGEKIVRKTICPDCGTEVAPGAKFCAECGHKFAATASMPATSSPNAFDSANVKAAVERVFALFHDKDGNCKNATKADAELVAKAAKDGNARAMFLLGEIYSYGCEGFAKNPKVSTDWYRKSAEAGDPWGMGSFSSVLSGLVNEGTIAVDFDEAGQWVVKAGALFAVQGQSNMTNSLLLSLEVAKAVAQAEPDSPPDFTEAASVAKTLLKSVDNPAPDETTTAVDREIFGGAHFVVAMDAMSREDFDIAREHLELGAAFGNENCKETLSQMEGGDEEDEPDDGDGGEDGDDEPPEDEEDEPLTVEDEAPPEDEEGDHTVQVGENYAQTGESSTITFSGGRFQAGKEDFHLQFDSIENTSSWVSGSLRIALWFTDEPYENGDISGTKMGEADLEPFPWLKPGPDNALTDYDAAIPFAGDPPSGEYYKAVVASELHEDGNWYIVGGMSFNKKFRWTQGMAKNYLRQKDGLPAMTGYSSDVTISGVSWKIANGQATLQAQEIANKSAWNTGALKLILWYCSEQFSGDGKLNGVQMAEGLISKNSLLKGHHFANASVSGPVTGNPDTGDYWSVVTVNELHEDGKWYIVGYANFETQNHWNHEVCPVGSTGQLSPESAGMLQEFFADLRKNYSATAFLIGREITFEIVQTFASAARGKAGGFNSKLKFINPGVPIAFIDATMFKSRKAGLLITQDGLFAVNGFGTPKDCPGGCITWADFAGEHSSLEIVEKFSLLLCDYPAVGVNLAIGDNLRDDIRQLLIDFRHILRGEDIPEPEN